MIFESMWPLLFLVAVPIIIILYLLKPKGVDMLISSNLLWQKLLKNQQSKTFFEKFVHNILMYLQILIVALLVISLMAPFIRTQSQGGGRKLLLLDTSGSMQHVNANGKSRLEEAVEQACDYIRTMENTSFSVITADATGVELLAVDTTDKTGLVQLLQGIECSDSAGALGNAQSILDSLAGDSEENSADLLVFTDGSGATEFEALHSGGDKELHVVGEATSNVANEYVVFSQRDDGDYDVMVSLHNYSAQEASFDVTLYDEMENIIALSRMVLEAGETSMCLFEQVDWQGDTLSSKISGITFAQGDSDSLAADNVSRTVKNPGNLIEGLLVGEGNTFLEKAYEAVTGSSISKALNDGAAYKDTYNVVIYDAGRTPLSGENNCLIFGNAGQDSAEVLENVVLDMTDCDLTAGLSGFHIGVNTAYSFTLPEGAESFLEYNGKCVGYYGEINGRKEVVVGFDIRESDFPLRAEFPVFLANAMIYLSDTSWLATNEYYAGEELALQPWAEVDMSQVESRPQKAGVYYLGNDTYQEAYVVRFQTATESDGQAEAPSVIETDELRLQTVRKTLRNVFVVLALVLLVIEWVVYVRQMRYNGKFYLVLRSVVLLCIILALLGVSLPVGSKDTATIFMVDLSNSNEEHLQEAAEYLQETIEKMPSGNEYGIVTFGKNTLVEQFLTDQKYYGGLMTLPEKAATNFEEAFSKALTLLSQNANKRLVVLTDGKETRGDIQHMAQALTAGQVEFLTLLYEDVQTQDAYVDNVTLPAYLHPGDKYNIQVTVESNYDTDAVIVLYNGSQQTATNQVHLNKGSNRFVFSEQVSMDTESKAMENLQVRVQAPGDTCEENDFYSAYSVIESTPRVLVISGQGTGTSEFTSVLNAAGCDYSVVSGWNAPTTILEMLDYKSIILVDTYIDDLPQGFLDNVESYVKDYGCGFVCCGGDESFALGGYRDTVLETILPVDMERRNVNEAPSMAMVMVIDRSGSMTGSVGNSGASNLDIAIKAATVAVDNLRDEDYVGVLTFDDGYEWQVELVKANDRKAIKEKIEDIAGGGGTTIKPAVQEAYKALLESDASVKHVVLLTDGMGETTNFNDVISDYTSAGITLSTVAVGDGSDTRLLEQLANRCSGRYYYSDISSDIPKIFAQEVFLGGDSYLQNGEFGLAVQGGHEIMSNLFADGWPILYGYVAATPKTASQLLIASAEENDPILTTWQYGLGRTVAWNSDVTGEWTGAFAGKEDYVQLWKRVVDYSTGNADIGEDSVDIVTSGEMTEIVYQTKEYTSDTEIVATVIDPEGEKQEVKLYATAPGKYETQLPTEQTGLYHMNIRRMEDEEIQSYMTTAAAVQFSDEYKFDVSTAKYLSFVEQYGRLITTEEEIWNTITNGTRDKRPLTNFLLGLAICLFLVDVAVRRFQYVPAWKGFGELRRKKADGGAEEGAYSETQGDTAGGSQRNESSAMSGVATGSAAEQAADSKAPGQVSGGKELGQVSGGKEAGAVSGGGKRADKKQKPAKEKTKKQKKPQEQTLDTSALLKKKDDRNQ